LVPPVFPGRLAAAFHVYLVSCLRLRDKLDAPRKLACVYPLLMAAFVTVNMVKIPWGIIERFLFSGFTDGGHAGARNFCASNGPKNARLAGIRAAAGSGRRAGFRVAGGFTGLCRIHVFRLFQAARQPVLS
jgi:hypothetical protein